MSRRKSKGDYHWAVVGRILHDDEDSCYTVQARSRAEAVTEFERRIKKDGGWFKDQESAAHAEEGIIVNYVLCSTRPIVLI